MALTIITTIVATLIVSSIAVILQQTGWDAKTLKNLFVFFELFGMGTLLGMTFFDLGPKIFADKTMISQNILLYTLGGMLVFFAMESGVHWYRVYRTAKGAQNTGKRLFHPVIELFINFFHHLLDGVALAIAFLMSNAIGVASFMSLIFHERPSSISDTSIIGHSNLYFREHIVYRLWPVIASFLGVLIVYLIGFDVKRLFIPSMIIFASGGFLYLSCATISLEIQNEKSIKASVGKAVVFLLGIFTIYAMA